MREFNIQAQEGGLLSRCGKCNGSFIDRCSQLMDVRTVDAVHTALVIQLMN